MSGKPKLIPYLLLAIVLVLSIVFFVQTQNDGEEIVEQQEEVQAVESVAAGEYMVDTTQTMIAWMGEKKLVNSSHAGLVRAKSGMVMFDEAGMLSGGEVVIDMTTITLDEDDNGGEQLLGHLASPDFFDIANHPEAMIAVTDVVEAENGFQVTADLTIKGITEPVVFTAIPTASSEEGVTLVADIAFDRALYDVQFGSESFFDNLGDQIIKDEIVMQVSLVAKRSE